MELRIERAHTLSCSEACDRVRKLEPALQEKYGVHLVWDGLRARVAGTGISGTIAVEAHLVAMDLRLGLLLRPLAAKIRSAIERQIDEVLA